MAKGEIHTFIYCDLGKTNNIGKVLGRIPPSLLVSFFPKFYSTFPHSFEHWSTVFGRNLQMNICVNWRKEKEGICPVQ